MSKKYGRTYHLPGSPGATSDDKILKSLSVFEQDGGIDVVATEKMDGENTTIYYGGTHARSVDGRYHPSRDRMKAFAAGISPMLATDERIVGEYLYARHSISYEGLPHFFMGFAWIKDDVIQSWDDTMARFDELGIVSVPLLWRGEFDARKIAGLIADLDLERQEGFVVRATQAFTEDQMSTHMGKYVREGHVQTDKHWMHQEVVPNGLKM
jgi:hypothetical protein